MKREVSFYSGPGLKLAAKLYLPEDGHVGKRPAVVLCQGPGRHKAGAAPENDLMKPFSERFVAAGYVVLRIYYRGVGESEGPASRLIPLEQVEDIRNAITFVQQQPEVDAQSIGLFGLATGGANVSYVAGIDERVRCMVSVNGMGDTGRWHRGMRRYWEWVALLNRIEEDRVRRVLTGESQLLEMSDVVLPDAETAAVARETAARAATQNRVSLESAETMLGYRPESVVGRISPRAAMWIGAKGDTLVPNGESQSMYDRAGEPKQLLLLEGVSHHGLYVGAGCDMVMANALPWFKAHLQRG